MADTHRLPDGLVYRCPPAELADHPRYCVGMLFPSLSLLVERGVHGFLGIGGYLGVYPLRYHPGLPDGGRLV